MQEQVSIGFLYVPIYILYSSCARQNAGQVRAYSRLPCPALAAGYCNLHTAKLSSSVRRTWGTLCRHKARLADAARDVHKSGMRTRPLVLPLQDRPYGLCFVLGRDLRRQPGLFHLL